VARGDHLFVDCPGYSHHGIDCGNGRVIHFESQLWRKALGILHRDFQPRVREVGWSEFTQGRPVVIRQYDNSDDESRVVERARSRIGQTNYDLWHNNCEHFAVWCKTGIAQSSQVHAATRATRPLGTCLAALALASRTSRFLPPPLRHFASSP